MANPPPGRRLPRPVPADARQVVAQNMRGIPTVERARVAASDFAELRDWWFVLLPLLLWIGWCTYRSERRQVLAERAARQQHQTA